MKKYIEPTIKVKEIEVEEILAASLNGVSNDLNSDSNEALDETTIQSKQFGNVSSWDEDDDAVVAK